jgi:AraC-like DNA-binding protein
MKTQTFKYTNLSKQDQELGLYITVVGTSNIPSNSEFPIQKGHPAQYLFNLEKGRILHEYQIIYITQGCGIFQNKHKIFKVQPGSVIILFPGEWHRYRPLKSSGWKSRYIGFDGEMVKLLLKRIYFTTENPIQYIGINEEIINYFDQIYDLTLNEKPGYHQICVGLLIAYISQIIGIIKYREFEGTDVEIKIKQACGLLNEHTHEEIDTLKIAKELNMGYSYFRKMFTKYTGLPPKQYHLQSRIRKAQYLLISSNKSIKEIAYELGFESAFYFSRIFKEKTKISPTDYRKAHTP